MAEDTRVKNYLRSVPGLVIPGGGAISHALSAEKGESFARGATAAAGGIGGSVGGMGVGAALAALLKQKNPRLLATLLAGAGGVAGGAEAATYFDKNVSKHKNRN